MRRRKRWLDLRRGKEESPNPTEAPEEHVLASKSQNYIEKFFLDDGHTAEKPKEDYGIDLEVKTFDDNGFQEPGVLQFQLKGSTDFELSKDGSDILFDIEVKHYNQWIREAYPVFLVLYDAGIDRAYYLYIQHYFTVGRGKGKKPKIGAQTIAVRVPLKNKFTRRTAEYMRKRKSLVHEQIQKIGIKHEA